MKKMLSIIIILWMTLFFIGNYPKLDSLALDDPLLPLLSHSSGFYTEGFYLTIQSQPNTTIYYTCDGSDPSDQSLRYISPIWIDEEWVDVSENEITITEDTKTIDSPISMIKTSDKYFFAPKEDIFKATVIKVLVIDDESNKQSEVFTNNFFVSSDMMLRYTFPVMAITTDPMNLYDYEMGIQIPGSTFIERDDDSKSNRTGNYFQTGDAWERPIYVELFETNGLLSIAQHAGLRIHGGLSRSYPIKSYRLYARSEYDEQKTFDYAFFKDKDIQTFKKIILRNGGQSFQYTLMGEAFAQSLLKPLDLDIQYSTPIILFINGEYFGIRNVRDRFDTDYLETHYQVDEKDATILAGHAYLEDGSIKGQFHYQQLYNYVTFRNIDQMKQYDKINRWMDIDNFIDYMIAELYMGNVDWPQNNILYWRKNVSYDQDAPYGHDGRWRWMITDLDASFGISWGTIDPDVNSFERLTGDSWKTGKLFISLLENDQFRSKFIYRLIELNQTIFNPDNVINQLEEMILLYEPEMEEHISRYSHPRSLSSWLVYTDRMKRFAQDRDDYLLAYMEDFFEISDTHKINLSYDKALGYLEVNGKKDGLGEHEGYYYENVLTEVKALPKEGYYLEGWYIDDQLISSEDTIYVSPEKTLDIEARFMLGESIPDNNDVFTISATVFTILMTMINLSYLIILIKRKK